MDNVQLTFHIQQIQVPGFITVRTVHIYVANKRYVMGKGGRELTKHEHSCDNYIGSQGKHTEDNVCAGSKASPDHL